MLSKQKRYDEEVFAARKSEQGPRPSEPELVRTDEPAALRQVRRNFVQPEVADVPSEVARAICSSNLAGRVLKGGRIAVTVGSRGIAGMPQIVRAAVETPPHLGFDPFIVAAMGWHGGGTAEGQRRSWPNWE